VEGKSKILTFEPAGKIGEGQNENEHEWRVDGSRLEILNDRNEVYSRFYVLIDGMLQHTNDADTYSIKGQYMEPIRTPVELVGES
jgi:hypothetical protein